MTGTILLVACATLLTVNDHKLGGILTVVLAVSGIVFSILSLILGHRQKKFHAFLQDKAQKVFDVLSEQEKDKYAYYHVLWLGKNIRKNLKKMTDSQDSLFQQGLLYKDDNGKLRYKDYILNCWEGKCRSRNFLTWIPLGFTIIYLCFIVGGLYLFLTDCTFVPHK